MRKYFAILALVLIAASCGKRPYLFQPVPGFSDATNIALEQFLLKTRDEKGRRVAVFDGDGTTIGQAPHYLADECLYRAALEEPGRRPDLVRRMMSLSNVSMEYVQMRVLFFEGDTVQSLRDRGEECFQRYYGDKIFAPMKSLIELLKQNGFEIWIVSASPEAMYQQFMGKAFGIPMTNVIGVKSIVRGGRITSEIVRPVPQDRGKKEAVETFVQEVPLFAAGNSRGDREMIEFSRGIRMIINPDEHVERGETESVASYARRNRWLIECITDEPSPSFPAVASKNFGIKRNKTHIKGEGTACSGT
jgi:phosphoserine phosphatase